MIFRQWLFRLFGPFLLIVLYSIATTAEKPGGGVEIKEYIYKDSDPPSDPIIEYHNPNYPDDPASLRPDFINDDVTFHRVVEFYSPLCPHCRNFAPHYIAFARTFTNLTTRAEPHTSQYAGLDVRFYAVSCKKYNKICRQEKINQYPRFKIFPAATAANNKQAGKVQGVVESSARRATVLTEHELVPLRVLNALGVEAVDDVWEENEEKKEVSLPKEEVKPSLRIERVEQPGDDSSKVPHHLPRSRQEVFSDAYLSFHTAMTTSVFMEEGPLFSQRSGVLRIFLQLLQNTMPVWRIHSLLGSLLNDFDAIVKDESKWSTVLEQYPPRIKQWSPACRKHANPYTCGLWTLFHIMTVGVVEFNQGSAVQLADNKLKPQDAADALKNYVQHFFLCEECTNHFVQGYESCAYDRCDRMNYSAIAKKRRMEGKDKSKTKENQLMTAHEFWAQLPLWLLDFHNGVNIRLQQERFQREQHQPTKATPQEEQNVMWPPVRDCPACWINPVGASATYDETIMYDYMKLTYWPEDESSAATRRRIMEKASPTSGYYILWSSATGTENLYLNLAFLSLFGVLVWNKKRLEILLGFNKKNKKHNV